VYTFVYTFVSIVYAATSNHLCKSQIKLRVMHRIIVSNTALLSYKVARNHYEIGAQQLGAWLDSFVPHRCCLSRYFHA